MADAVPSERAWTCSLACVLSQTLLTRVETPEPERKPDYTRQISQ